MNEEKEVKTRPIIFTGDSVPKIIEGKKTMTRRVAKKLPLFGPSFHELNYERHPFSPSALNVCEDINIPLDPILERMSWVGYDWCGNAIGVEEVDFLKCPYGMPGDFLYVKETWHNSFATDDDSLDGYVYKSTNNGPDPQSWKSPMFMPRKASRILLKVESVVLQLLQQIDEKDAKIEGYESKDSFRRGWDTINSKRGFGWEDNVWVWVIGFSIVSIKKKV